MTESKPTTLRILFVDDEPALCRAMARRYKQVGHVLETACNEEQAFAMVASQEFDAVVVDLKLGATNGQELVAAMSRFAPDPVYVLTTGGECGPCKDGEAPPLLWKPFEIDELTAAIDVERERRRRSARLVERVLVVSDAAGLGTDIAATVSDLDAAHAAPEVAQAASLSEALALLHEGRFDLVALALGAAPSALGVDALMRLRAAAADSTLVVIDERLDPPIARLIRHGADEVLTQAMLGRDDGRRAIRLACERTRAQRHLIERARRDSLTGLLNRSELSERFEHARAVAMRAGSKIGVLFIDLDGFKQVNDQLGHELGDALLVEIARRMSVTVRAADTLARIGGDEFVVFIENVSEREEITGLVTRLQRAVTAPVTLGRDERRVGASIGVALCPDEGSSLESLLRVADADMYAAKRARKRVGAPVPQPMPMRMRPLPAMPLYLGA